MELLLVISKLIGTYLVGCFRKLMHGQNLILFLFLCKCKLFNELLKTKFLYHLSSCEEANCFNKSKSTFELFKLFDHGLGLCWKGLFCHKNKCM